MPTYALSSGILTCDEAPLLSGVAVTISLAVDPAGVGAFLTMRESKVHQRQVCSLGTPAAWTRFTCTSRTEPFWMVPRAGTTVAEIPGETQWLLAQGKDGRCVLIVPLFNSAMRFSLSGKGETLELVGETGDPQRASNGGGLAAFIAVGDDPYALIPLAAAAVSQRLGSGRLRREKALPAGIDVFGWCTWDAFYQDVSHDKVREGLEALRVAGVPPRLLILDDGWQSESVTLTGERRLTAFAANAKFPGDLEPTVAMAKGEFGIETFLVWHAVIGYWGGVDGAALPGYGVREVGRRLAPTLTVNHPTLDDWWGNLVGVVPPEHVARFYHDYHRHLRGQGVDGVKIDNQAVLETVAEGSGGRVALTRAYREALEGSAAVHFSDRVINCMSCATETWYLSNTTNLIRTSTDFWPLRPESHGLHLYTNAQVCLWFGEFLHADWDMFQSAHAMGPYHAAGRAVSGAPVYVSDKPGAHGVEVLRKLVLSDGSVPRCRDLGRPMPDCLYRDPTKEAVLLQIFNRNDHGWVVGVFNARHHTEEALRVALAGHVSPAAVPGLTGERFVLHAHQSGLLATCGREGRISLTLAELAYEVVSIVPEVDGCAVIGLAQLFNPAAAISGLRRSPKRVEVDLRDGGRFLAWCASKPSTVTVDGKPVGAGYDDSRKALTIDLAPGVHAVSLAW